MREGKRESLTEKEKERERERGSLAARLRGHGGRRGRHRAWPGAPVTGGTPAGSRAWVRPTPDLEQGIGGKEGSEREREEREKRVFGERECVLLSRES